MICFFISYLLTNRRVFVFLFTLLTVTCIQLQRLMYANLLKSYFFTFASFSVDVNSDVSYYIAKDENKEIMDQFVTQ